MDTARFDALTRTITRIAPRVSSRRSLLHLVQGAVAIRSVVILPETEARRRKKKCKRRTKCAGKCVDLRTDPANCGLCGHACGTGHVCDSGGCRRLSLVAISASVGEGGNNVPDDVRQIQDALNLVPVAQGGANPTLAVTGLVEARTMKAIRRFQQFHDLVVDSLITPAGAFVVRLNDILRDMGHLICRSLRDTCEAQEDCCRGDCDHIHSEPGSTKEFCRGTTQPVCCLGHGSGICRNSCECCGTLECVDGSCLCRERTQKCTHTDQCCFGVCDIVHRKDDETGGCLIPDNDPDPRYCCVREGKLCTGSCECCGHLVCREGSCAAPHTPPPPSCVDYGGSCRTSAECCNAVPCIDRHCRYP